SLGYVDRWAPPRVGFGVAQYLSGDGRDLTVAEDEVAQHVHDWVALGPAEVDERQLARLVADVEQQGRDRVGHGRALGPQDAVAVAFLPGDPQHRPEPRGGAHGYLQEQHGVAGRDVVVRAFLAFFLQVLALVALVGLIGD